MFHEEEFINSVLYGMSGHFDFVGGCCRFFADRDMSLENAKIFRDEMRLSRFIFRSEGIEENIVFNRSYKMITFALVKETAIFKSIDGGGFRLFHYIDHTVPRKKMGAEEVVRKLGAENLFRDLCRFLEENAKEPKHRRKLAS